MRVDALLVADHVYQDAGTGKYVVAGTFQQINAPFFPSRASTPVAVFVRLSGVNASVAVKLDVLDVREGTVLFETDLFEVRAKETDGAVDFAVEIPPLPLPHPGRFEFRLQADDRTLASTAVAVVGSRTD